MPTKPHLEAAKKDFKKAIDHLLDEYAKLQIGRASTALVEGLMIDVYGTQQPLKAIASLSCPDPRTIQIQPWDKGNLVQIESAIQTSGLNLTPNNDGIVIRINIPSLTEERRTELTKIVHKLAEDARISVRHARQAAHDSFKKQEEDKEISEDDRFRAEKLLQEDVDAANKEIEEHAKKKEEDIMTI